MSERTGGGYDDALYKSTYTLPSLIFDGPDKTASSLSEDIGQQYEAARFLYSTAYAMTGPARFTISEVAVDWHEPMVLQRKLRPSNCTR